MLPPFLGFGLGGISAGSFAASIQGPAVVAGSFFAVLQSLGATGIGILLFGSIGGAIGLLSPLVAKLGWCNGCSEGDEQKVKCLSQEAKSLFNESIFFLQLLVLLQPMVSFHNKSTLRKSIDVKI
jgi:hypothetical protein